MTITVHRTNLFLWRCPVKNCRKLVQSEKKLVKGSKISLKTIILFIYCWCIELTSVKFCKNQLHISDKTIVDFNNYSAIPCIILHLSVMIKGTIKIFNCVYIISILVIYSLKKMEKRESKL
ncbi:hypothetical protein Avbf_12146 [Armadillidium vulgare]|nr:hypothetical protein Avbf_12146 [Armadillidium vulgare]